MWMSRRHPSCRRGTIELRICDRAAEPERRSPAAGHHQGTARFGCRAIKTITGGSRTDQAPSRLHQFCGSRSAGLLAGRMPSPACEFRPASRLMAHRAAGRCLGHGEFQGNAAEAHAHRAGSENKSRCVWRPDIYGHIDSIAAASGARFSLLPPENATGNYVKVVQRVPVKIVLDPGQNQDRLLRPGLSVDPTVLLNSK